MSEARVAVLMGGTSAERDISMITGRAILGVLAAEGISAVGVDTAGKWQDEFEKRGIEVAFIALHGRGGEDGTIQGALELMGVPYTGSGILASALAMDKIQSKRIFTACGIPTPEYQVMAPGLSTKDIKLSMPVVVKPSREGSTIGVSVVKDIEELEAAVAKASSHDPNVLIESFVEGDDLTVGVLNGRPMAVVQIIVESGFYDYHTKYVTGAEEYRVPAPIGEIATEAIRNTARKAAVALRCSGAVRVDFRGTGDDFTVIEVNTVPGMTPTSLLPKSAAGMGIGFNKLVMEMLKTAGEGSR